MTLPRSRSLATRPQVLRWTCDEFHRLGDLGMFEGRRAMLIDGVVLEEGPMNPPHAITLELVDAVLRATFGAGWRIRSQSPLLLGQHLDPEPDFMVIAGTARGSNAHPTTADLVVEVADSSLAFDSDEKRRIYATAGIPEYWLVDVSGRRLLVYRDPRAGDYDIQQVFGPGDTVSPLALTTATVRVAELLV